MGVAVVGLRRRPGDVDLGVDRVDRDRLGRRGAVVVVVAGEAGPHGVGARVGRGGGGAGAGQAGGVAVEVLEADGGRADRVVGRDRAGHRGGGRMGVAVVGLRRRPGDVDLGVDRVDRDRLGRRRGAVVVVVAGEAGPHGVGARVGRGGGGAGAGQAGGVAVEVLEADGGRADRVVGRDRAGHRGAGWVLPL